MKISSVSSVNLSNSPNFTAINLNGKLSKGTKIVQELSADVLERTKLPNSKSVKILKGPVGHYTGRELVSETLLDKINKLKAQKYRELNPDAEVLDWTEVSKMEVSDAEISEFASGNIKGAGDTVSDGIDAIIEGASEILEKLSDTVGGLFG